MQYAGPVQGWDHSRSLFDNDPRSGGTLQHKTLSTMHTKHFTVHTARCVVHTARCSAHRTLHGAQRTPVTAQDCFTEWSRVSQVLHGSKAFCLQGDDGLADCTVCTVGSLVCSVQYVVYSVRCAVCSENSFCLLAAVTPTCLPTE